MANSKHSRRNKRDPLETLECNTAIVRVKLETKKDTEKLNKAPMPSLPRGYRTSGLIEYPRRLSTEAAACRCVLKHFQGMGGVIRPSFRTR